MKIIKSVLISLFCLLPASLLHAYDSNVMSIDSYSLIHNESIENSSFYGKYLQSVIPGILTGTCAGGLCAYFDYMVPTLWPLTWLITFMEREALIKNISIDMENHAISHNRPLMHLCSLVSTWIIYFHCYQKLAGERPF